ncbi:uncharacterized protein HaLaN_19539, partial [Haematococcus lacustris]
MLTRPPGWLPHPAAGGVLWRVAGRRRAALPPASHARLVCARGGGQHQLAGGREGGFHSPAAQVHGESDRDCVDGVMLSLRQSITAGEQWKLLYKRTARAVNSRCPRPWDFDTSSIFAHIDAFLQRCMDLLEVCEAQLQFAPRTPLPAFGGTKGPEVCKSILDIQAAFKRLVSGLQKLDINILDVKATRWHDEYNTFKAGVKDLEVMLTNVIQLACEAQACLTGRMELLEAFNAMAKCDFI